MSTTPASLGPYPVERELGRGGMGVVYLARDPRLNRQVAIKVLPETLVNPESLARFDREAKLLASLNHPNIATIYGVEEISTVAAGLQPGGRILVLEYIPGDTLAGHIERGPLALDETLEFCRQIALAIEAAHEGGVIHRDLKPGNIKITPDGQVKVLDFGLAKGSDSVSDAELAHSPTMTFAATAMGVILGTAGYMSPEQARGKAVDRRTDIWSFGCVLFECLTGRQIFKGETVSDTIAKILEREPDWNALPANTPPAVRDILRRCLEKDLKKRQRDIGDVRIQLEEAAAARSSSVSLRADTTPPTPRFGLSMKTTALATLLIVFGAAAGIGLWKMIGAGSETAAGPIRASFAVPSSIHATVAGIAPDGRRLMLFGYLRRPDGTDDPVLRAFSRGIDDYDVQPIVGAERLQNWEYSPNGRELAVVNTVSDRSTQLQLVTMPIDGSSPPVRVAEVGDNWSEFAWLASGDFLVGHRDGTRYFRLSRTGGAPGPDISFDTGGSGSARVFTTIGNLLPDDRGVFLDVDSYNTRGYSTDVWVLDLAAGKALRLVENASSARYAPTGHIVFSRGETMLAAPFDFKSLRVTGDVVALSRGLRISAAWAHGTLVFSGNGTLVYAPGGLVGDNRRLASVDAAGVVTPFGADRRAYEGFPIVSPDGRRVSVTLANDKNTYEVWTTDTDRQVLSRSIAIPGVDCQNAYWSPDGRLIAFWRYGQAQDDGVYIQNADGTGSPRLLFSTGSPGIFVNANSWMSDSSGMVVTKYSNNKPSLWLAPVPIGAEPAAPRALRATSSSDWNGQVSPDGRLLAFYSDESGKGEVYVATFAGGVLGRPLPVSNGTASRIQWAGDSRRLFYGSLDGKLMLVNIDAKASLTSSAPVVVHDLKRLRVNGWSILPDGRLFIVQRSEAEDDITHFSVVFNWFDELRAKMAKK